MGTLGSPVSGSFHSPFRHSFPSFSAANNSSNTSTSATNASYRHSYVPLATGDPDANSVLQANLASFKLAPPPGFVPPDLTTHSNPTKTPDVSSLLSTSNYPTPRAQISFPARDTVTSSFNSSDGPLTRSSDSQFEKSRNRIYGYSDLSKLFDEEEVEPMLGKSEKSRVIEIPPAPKNSYYETVIYKPNVSKIVQAIHTEPLAKATAQNVAKSTETPLESGAKMPLHNDNPFLKMLDAAEGCQIPRANPDYYNLTPVASSRLSSGYTQEVRVFRNNERSVVERANIEDISKPTSGEDRKLAKLAPKRQNPSLPNLSKLASMRDSDDEGEGENPIRMKPILKKNKFSVSTNRLNPFSPLYDPGKVDPAPKTDTNPFRNKSKTPLVLGEEFFASLFTQRVTTPPALKKVTFTSTDSKSGQTNQTSSVQDMNRASSNSNNDDNKPRRSVAVSASSSSNTARTNPPLTGPSPFTPSWPTPSPAQPVGVSVSASVPVPAQTGLSPLKPGTPSGMSQSKSGAVAAPPKKPEEDKYAALKNLDDLFKSSATIQDSKRGCSQQERPFVYTVVVSFRYSQRAVNRGEHLRQLARAGRLRHAGHGERLRIRRRVRDRVFRLRLGRSDLPRARKWGLERLRERFQLAAPATEGGSGGIATSQSIHR